MVNEGIVELYSVSELSLPSEQAQSTITLVAADRDYSLASDLVQLRWPLRDKTNSQWIWEFPGGYNAMLDHDIEQDDTGLPHYAAIRPTDGQLHLDVAPTANEAGRVYTYQYDKSLLLTAAASTVPFSDEVFTHMVPAWVQKWKRERRNEFDLALYNEALGVASRLLTKKQMRTSYCPR